ncbi:PKD domain-containing protein [Haloferula sargassicola]|uniref:PKD domain-containing protein n=1 Tax=Haloferula sargassicola TaxID=490096 RepID=A0ABP9UWE3_9BACT
MRELIATDPQRALAEAISRAEYAALPEEIRPFYEQPFNATATLRVLPVCSGPGHEPDRILEINGRYLDASVFGRRLSQMTLEEAPLHGIVLDGLAAIAEMPLERVASADEAALSQLPVGNPDPSRDFATGEPLGVAPVTALAGGKRYLFRDAASIAVANQRLVALDEAVGPKNGSRIVFELAGGGDGTTGIDWPLIETLVSEQASSWSETPKSVFCIRVDFPDVPGETVSQATLANVMNTSVRDAIEAMSYGKTWIDAGVSPMTVRMPQPSTAYLPSENGLLHDEAKDAYLALAGATALDGYDIVVVHFPGIGIASSSGTIYGGLAGGSRQWLQGSHSASLITHEFGHNYGLPHAGFWATTDGTATGEGSNEEYGDFTDVMGGGSVPEGHFHPLGKMHLGWLGAGQWADATSSGTYRIYRFDDPATTGTLRGLRIDKTADPEDPAEYYWLGFRAGHVDEPVFQQSAYLIWQRPTFNNRAWLIDTTPGSADGKFDAPITLGRTYSDETAGVHLTPTATGGSGADAWIEVNVQLGDFPGNQSPTGSIVGPTTADARTAVSFTASASDPDGHPLAYSWDFGDGATAANQAAVSHTWTVGGSYTVTCTVSDMKGGTAVLTRAVTVGDPLDTWSATPIGPARTINRAAYLDGRFVATGDDYAYLSFDAAGWTSISLGSGNFSGEGIAAGAGDFVIAGEDWINSAWAAAAYHSPDGRSWQRANLPSSAPLNDVAFGNGVFVAVGDTGTVLRSADGGKTWTSVAAISAQNLRSIAFGDGTFVVVSADEIHTSTEGLTWIDRTSGHSAASWHSFNRVAFADGRFFTAGWYSNVHVSDDLGATWRRTPVAGTSDYDIAALGAGGNARIAFADDKDESDAPSLLVSTDGDAWTESTATLPGASFGTIAFGGGVFFSAAGNPGEAWTSGSFFPSNQAPIASVSGPTSADARTQILLEASASDPDGDPLRLVWDFKDGSPLVEGSAAAHIFPGGGSYQVELIATDERGGVTVETHDITVTDPLDTWSDRVSGVTVHLNDIAASPTRVVAVGGRQGWSNEPNFLHSTDGLNWTSGSLGRDFNTRSIIWDGSQFLAAGQEYAFGPVTVPVSGWYGAIHTSPDGMTWTYRLIHTGASLNGIAGTGSLHVAVGDSGAIWRSADGGVTWNSVPAPTALDLRDVAYLDGTFLAVTESSYAGSPVKVLSSTNGLVWTDVSAGAGIGTWQEFVEIEALGDRFLASGWYAGIRRSTDLGAAFTLSGSQNRRYSGFATGNGLWFAAGIDYDNSSAPLDAISQDGSTWIELPTTAAETRNAAVFFADTFITVGENGSIRQSDAFSAPAETGYAAWSLARFPEAPPFSDADEDFDGDGLTNLHEYLTGTDPRDAADRVAVSLSSDEAGVFVEIPRSPFATDAIIEAEFSTDLDQWSPAGLTVIENSATRYAVQVTDASPQGFLRFRMSLLP